MNAFVMPGFASAEACAIARAALSVYIDKNPSLQHEITCRVTRVSEAIDFVETMASEAAFHDFDPSLQSFAGVLGLIGREVKMIDILFDALMDSQAATSQEAKL